MGRRFRHGKFWVHSLVWCICSKFLAVAIWNYCKERTINDKDTQAAHVAMDVNEITHTAMWMRSSTNIKDGEKEEPINEIVALDLVTDALKRSKDGIVKNYKNEWYP